jgi:hypothetical protein
MSAVRLGERYRDSITGYEGTATCRAEHFEGSVKVLLERGHPDTGAQDEEWFNEGRLSPPDEMKSAGFR